MFSARAFRKPIYRLISVFVVVVLLLLVGSVVISRLRHRAPALEDVCTAVAVRVVGTETDCVKNGCVSARPANTRLCLRGDSDEWHDQGQCDVPSGMCVATFFECKPCAGPLLK
jgi:hypothetical protein